MDNNSGAQSGSDTFNHCVLEVRHAQIRVITIDRRKRQLDGIHLYLKAVNTNTVIKPSYFAISYIWGPENGLREIHINGKKFWVRQNLFALLGVLKSHSTLFRQWFWIDQICIDQGNIGERNFTVARMGNIYQSAKEVIVWLGESNNDLDYAFDALVGKLRVEEDSTLDFGRLKKAMAAFSACNYWKRLWIVQEMLLARKVSYWCGERVASQKNMSQTSKSYSIREGRDYELPWILVDKACSGPKGWDWKLLLLRFGSQQCANPLDRVYGLQGLVQPLFRVNVDYATKRAQLVIFVLMKCIEEWFMQHEQLNPGNVLRENFDMGINLMDALFGDTYRLGALIVIQALVWSACLFQYQSRVSQPSDKWLSFWGFLDEARIPSHRNLAQSVRDNLVRYEIAARNWISWRHLDRTQQIAIQHAEYSGSATRAVKQSITLAIGQCGYKSGNGYFKQRNDVDFAELLETTSQEGAAGVQLTDKLPQSFVEALNTPRSDRSKKELFAIRFLDDSYRVILPRWYIYDDDLSHLEP